MTTATHPIEGIEADYFEEGVERYDRLEEDINDRIGTEDAPVGTSRFAAALAGYVAVRARARGIKPSSTAPVDASEFEWFDHHAYDSYTTGRDVARNLLDDADINYTPRTIQQSGNHKRGLNTVHTRQRTYWGSLAEDLRKEVRGALESGTDGMTVQQARRNAIDRVRKVGADRAKRIASYEPSWAFGKGMVNEYHEANVSEVTIDISWETAGDRNVCSECRANAGTYTVSAVDGMLEAEEYPAHPYCRCLLIPGSS